MTSPTAHPYVVFAEHQWRREQLAGANLAPRHRRRVRRLLPRPFAGAARRTPRAV